MWPQYQENLKSNQQGKVHINRIYITVGYLAFCLYVRFITLLLPSVTFNRNTVDTIIITVFAQI